MIPDLTPQEIERFYSKLQATEHGMLWAGGDINSKGYGRFGIWRGGRRERIRILAHKLAYFLATGDDPSGLVTRHKCDIPLCCTPDCLLIGTQADNMQDAVARGRINLRGLDDYRAHRDAAARQRLITQLKRCSRCRIVKPFSEFNRASRSVDGHAYWCKTCFASLPPREKGVTA